MQFGSAMTWLFWLVVAAIIFVVARALTGSRHGDLGENTLSILEWRYARGEIEEEEYRRRRRELLRR